ncbi:Gfo/Idh/MocA family oxidoreductase [Thermoleophilia bacterium SCSIO 60948]|nr:Gfo/Idh/MocA family oxidoreductase [Thermoleophilia bacterium SCSIO 60948]
MSGAGDAVTVGVIGLGLVSGPHLDGYEQAEGAELVAVCDLSADKTRAVSDARGVPGTIDPDALIADPEIDAVALLLPHQVHHHYVRAALEAGKHVCVEKPITVTAAEADDLIAVAEREGLVLAVAENTRYVRAYVEAERIVNSGALGEIRALRGFIPDQILDEWADVADTTQAWKREPGGCGAIMDCAPHMLDLVTWYFGEVESLHAIGQRWVPEIPLDNHGVIVGRMAGGPFFSLEFMSVTEYPRGERVEIYGSEGTLVIDQVLDPPMIHYRGASDPHGTPVEGIGYDLEGWKPESIRATAHDFIAAIRDDRPPGVTAEQGRYVVSLVERAYRSVAENGRAS